MSDIYKTPVGEEYSTIEDLRKKLAKVVGITIQGTRCTLRWFDSDQNCLSVSMIITDVRTPSECKNETEKMERYREVVKQHSEVAKLFEYIEY